MKLIKLLPVLVLVVTVACSGGQENQIEATIEAAVKNTEAALPHGTTPGTIPTSPPTAASGINALSTATPNAVAATTELAMRQAVARVGDNNVSRAEFINAARFERFQLVVQYQHIDQAMKFFSSDPQSVAYFQQQQQQIRSELNDPTTLGRNVINSQIDDILIRQEAARRGIIVSSAEVDEANRAYYGYYPNGTPTPTITPSPAPTDVPPTINPTVAARLTAQPIASLAPVATSTPGPGTTPVATAKTKSATPTPYTTQGFATAVSLYLGTLQQQTGLGDADMRRMLESTLYRAKVEAALAAEVPTTADEVHARHILVNDVSTAQLVMSTLATGGDFVALAAQYSTDTATKDNAGDLGWFAKGQLDPAIDTVAFTITIGVFSGPIQSQIGTGFHIIQVLERGQHLLNTSALSAKRVSALQDWLDAQRSITTSSGPLVQIFDNWSNDVPTQPSLPTQ